MYNRELSDVLFPKEKAILTGQSVAQEGQLLIAALEGGVEKVAPCAGVANEVPVGFSSSTRLLIDKEVLAKDITVPSAGPFTVDLGYTNLDSNGAGQIVILNGAALLTNTTPVAPAAANDYSVNYLTGVVTFHSGAAGLALEVHFKRILSVIDSRTLYREGFLHNARAFEVYDVVGCFEGKGQIYTDQYDIAADYSAGNLKTMAGGLITVGGAGQALPAHVRVISMPNLSNPFLGLEFNF
jgi:hypothetical protein